MQVLPTVVKSAELIRKGEVQEQGSSNDCRRKSFNTSSNNSTKENVTKTTTSGNRRGSWRFFYFGQEQQ
jgi:hypothetical protein